MQREEELRQAIQQGASTHKLSKAAERVRTAKLDVAKALEFGLGQKKSKSGSVDIELEILKRDTARWETMPTEQIIELYQTAPL